MRTLILLLSLGMMSASAYPYGRSGNLADPSFLTTGDSAVAFSVTVDSSAPVLVYDSNSTGKWDREILIQNTSTSYDIYCGTFSAMSASSGPRFLLPKNPSSLTTNVRADFYCIAEPSAGATTIDVIGLIEFSTKD